MPQRHKTGIWKWTSRGIAEGKAIGSSRALRAFWREMTVEAIKQVPVAGALFESGVKASGFWLTSNRRPARSGLNSTFWGYGTPPGEKWPVRTSAEKSKLPVLLSDPSE